MYPLYSFHFTLWSFLLAMYTYISVDLHVRYIYIRSSESRSNLWMRVDMHDTYMNIHYTIAWIADQMSSYTVGLPLTAGHPDIQVVWTAWSMSGLPLTMGSLTATLSGPPGASRGHFRHQEILIRGRSGFLARVGATSDPSKS